MSESGHKPSISGIDDEIRKELSQEGIESPGDICDAVQEIGLSFDEQFVKNNLDNILLLLISLRNGANGKQLTEDVARTFNCVISSGTLYPYLYDLEDDGYLESRKHVQTREYVISDSETVESVLTNWVEQHLTLGAVLSSALS